MSPEDDLRLLLRAPQLSLDPTPGLPDRVRRRARVIRRRQRAAGGTLVAAALLTAGLAGPSLVARLRAPDQSAVAGQPVPDPRFPDATSEVVTLAPAGIFTYFRGDQWCTVARRLSDSSTCSPTGAGPTLSSVRGPGTNSLSIDRIRLAAGLAGADVAKIELLLSDGSHLVADLTDGHGSFPQPVWSASVPPSRTVERYTAYDAAGRVLGTRPG